MNQYVIGVIPARFASTRLPGKPLADVAGKPLIQWVWEACKRCERLDRIIVATDDSRISEACDGMGAEWAMTSVDCPSGSDRIYEAVNGLEFDVVVNIQGDEPLIDPKIIDRCVSAILSDDQAGVSSAMIPFQPGEDYTWPDMVKVVTDTNGYAMYFSRAPIPDVRRLSGEELAAAPLPMKHVGIYVYRKAALEQFVLLQPSKYELIEKLEQLRVLESGIKIRMVEIDSPAIGVDTPEDLEHVRRILRERTEGE